MSKLLTGNLPKGNLPHAQNDAVAADKFDKFSEMLVEMVAESFIAADAVESEVVGKIAFTLAAQQIRKVFNPKLADKYDAKRLRVLVISELAYHGQPVFKNEPPRSGAFESLNKAEEWVATNYAAGWRYLNRINDRFSMGKAAALAVLKANRGGVVACVQAGSQNAALKAFLVIAAPYVSDAMAAIKVAKASAKKAQPEKVEKVKKYLGNAELSAGDLAALLVHLNALHAAATADEAATIAAEEARLAAETEEEEEERLAA